mmetsp:Transcript_54755/g.152770  ORF Transcript_54755/g.152770 Transcript_54755/m.152770 type:complete len:211 (-) Transcript_54755:56-688(-)
MSHSLLAAELEIEAAGDDDGPRDEVAEGHWDEVLPESLRVRHGRAGEQACWQQEHVGHGVLEADANEHGDGEPNAHHLARHVLCLGAQEDRHADQPVAQDRLHELLAQSTADLLGNCRSGHCTGATAQQTCVPGGNCKGPTTDDVPDPGKEEAPEHGADLHLPLQEGSGHSSGVARVELAARLEDEQQVHGEERSEYKCLNGRVILGCAC